MDAKKENEIMEFLVDDEEDFSDVLFSINYAPFCDENKKITKVLICPYCYFEDIKNRELGQCFECFVKGKKHYVYCEIADSSFFKTAKCKKHYLNRLI